MWCELSQVSKNTCPYLQRITQIMYLWSQSRLNGAVRFSYIILTVLSLTLFSLKANFFDEYQIEGVSPEDNEICLEVAPENLSRALKTVQNAKAVKVKLTKKHCPCLTIAAELVSH